jgi:hypothetical protein
MAVVGGGGVGWRGGPLAWRPAPRRASERDVVRVGRVAGDGRGLFVAGLWPVLDVDTVQLERDAVLAGVGDVFARREASGEADGLGLYEVLGGGRGWACQTIRSR